MAAGQVRVAPSAGESISRRSPLVTFNIGSFVRISFRGKTVAGEVLMASGNGLSLTLMFEDQLYVYSKLMPVVWLDDCFVDLLLAEPVTISPQKAA
jgi:hypothetical protein